MSKYKKYAVRLEEAYKDAREAYRAKYDALKKAEERVTEASREYGLSAYDRERKIYRAKMNLEEVRDDFNKTAPGIWPKFQREAEAIGQELRKAIGSDNTARSADIDASALALLQSGIMRADDFEAMAEQFDENPTMLRMVAHYADTKAAEPGLNLSERSRLLTLKLEIGDGESSVVKSFDRLEEIATRFVKEGNPDAVMTYADNWERITGDAIENF